MGATEACALQGVGSVVAGAPCPGDPRLAMVQQAPFVTLQPGALTCPSWRPRDALWTPRPATRRTRSPLAGSWNWAVGEKAATKSGPGADVRVEASCRLPSPWGPRWSRPSWAAAPPRRPDPQPCVSGSDRSILPSGAGVLRQLSCRNWKAIGQGQLEPRREGRGV